MQLLDQPNQVMPGPEDEGELVTPYGHIFLTLFLPAIWKVAVEQGGCTRDFKLLDIILLPAGGLTRRLHAIANFNQVVNEGATRVPTFYGADTHFDSHWAWAFAFSVVFAAIHISGWYSPATFPSKAEHLLWMAFTSTILLLPPALFLCLAIFYLMKVKETIATPSMVGIYIIARIILLTLAFTTLRALPAGALNNIQWPHFILIFTGK